LPKSGRASATPRGRCKLPEGERRRSFRKMQLHWHPDKRKKEEKEDGTACVGHTTPRLPRCARRSRPIFPDSTAKMEARGDGQTDVGVNRRYVA